MKIIHITANSRLTAALKKEALQQRQKTVVETPAAMTYSQWLAQWREGCLLRGELALEELNTRVLSSFEAQLIWNTVLQEELAVREQRQREQNALDDVGAVTLLNVGATVKQLYQAWQISAEWFGDAWLEDNYLSDEVFLFKCCLQRYQQRLSESGWLDEVGQQQQSLGWLKQGKGIMPERFCLHGFEELSPFMQQWQQTVQQRGVEVNVITPNQKSAEQSAYYAAQDATDEVQQAVRWAMAQWQYWQAKKPIQQIQIALVAPNIADYKAALTQCLDEQLFLQGIQDLSSQQVESPFYNLSLGQCLLDLPLVQNAWQTIELFLEPERVQPYREWSRWLSSPYSTAKRVDRQQLDAFFRAQQRTQLSACSLAEYHEKTSLPKGLQKAISRWQQQADKVPQKLNADEFICVIEQLLQALDWCGGKTLNSDEYQQRQAFDGALMQFASVAEVAGKLTLRSWLGLLNRFMQEQIHQSKSMRVQPIQIMGMLEAGGQQFDSLWVMGLSDEAWPRAANPNPFLPMTKQREAGSPRCDAKRELLYAQKLTQRLSASATHLIWSYPQYAGEAELMASPLIPVELPDYQAEEYESLAASLYHQAGTGGCKQWFEDYQAPEVKQGTKAPGGTGILQAQSVCPLMAFFDFRLGAKYGLQPLSEGMETNFQGSLVHQILELFWQDVKNSYALALLDDEALTAQLHTIASQCFAEVEGAIDENYVTLEQNRIVALCMQWLALEKLREQFEVVSLETEYAITLAGIDFKVFIDRIDRVAGQHVILDYKTGSASINHLLTTPLKAPQLAVYLHAVTADVAGIGYAILHSDDGVKLSAIVAEEGVLPNPKGQRSVINFEAKSQKENDAFYEVAWDDFLDNLRQQVEELAGQIQQGYAPMLYERETDLQYAASKLALRLPEMRQQVSESTEEFA